VKLLNAPRKLLAESIAVQTTLGLGSAKALVEVVSAVASSHRVLYAVCDFAKSNCTSAKVADAGLPVDVAKMNEKHLAHFMVLL
jgi:hypothetical protein